MCQSIRSPMDVCHDPLQAKPRLVMSCWSSASDPHVDSSYREAYYDQMSDIALM